MHSHLRSMAWMIVGLLLSGSGRVVAAGVELVKDGTCKHRIVLQPGASPSETFAAQELQAHVKACTGVELPVLEAAPTDGAPMIVLGCGPVARKLGVDPKADQLGQQGFVLRTVPPHIVIAGTREAGTLYGVHRFLEDYLGVRWFTPQVTQTPAIKDLTVPTTDRLVKPAILMRSTSYTWPGRNAAFSARQAFNRTGQPADHPQGIGYRFRGTCHSYFGYVRPGEFFRTHPEYFSEIGGVRKGTETQLCLTNPDVLKIVTERMLKLMRDEPQHDQYNFSQMDYYNYCECAKCRAMNEKYGTPGATQFWFVNKLAEQTSKVHPDKLVGTLAYTYTEELPKGMKVHPNVAVWLCHMFPCCDSHPIATCPLNADYKRRATAWSKACSHLYIWHYVVDFAHYYNPFPNFRSMAADMKFYRDIGVEGIYLQGMGHGGGGGEFSLLRPYLGMKLVWDPDQDADAIIRDFLKGYYGAAAKPIHQYITMLHDKVQADNIHMHLYTNPAQGYLPDDVMARAMALFDQAEKTVQNDPELLERVRVARMPLSYARIFPRNGYKIEGGRLRWQGDMATQSEGVKFVQRMKKQGFRTIREWGGDPKLMLTFGGVFQRALGVSTIGNEHLSVDVVPLLGGRALRIVDRKTGQCVTAHNNTRVLFFPFAGGLEHRLGETFRFYGWIEPTTVLKQTDTSVTAVQQTMNSWKVTRTMSVVPGKPMLEVITRVTNDKDKPREMRLRGHLELDLGELRSTRVKFTSRAGKRVDKDMGRIIPGLREGEHYYDLDAPAGRWTFTGSKGLAVTHAFDLAPIDYAWLYAYPDYLGQLDAEVWLKRQTIAPGKSLWFRQTVEVRPAK